MQRDGALRLIRSVRRRLETVRLLRTASRGVLVGAIVALPFMILRDADLLAFAMLPAGAAVALALRGARHRVAAADAALFLDAALRTQERFVTALATPPGPLCDRILDPLPTTLQVPRLPFPREIGFLPLALFLLFAASLLPSGAAATAQSTPAAQAAVAGDAAPTALPDASAALAKLAAGDALAPEERALLSETIERTVPRPEERAAARASLERAKGGEGSDARTAARELAAWIGGSGGGGEEGTIPTGADVDQGNGLQTMTPYPEEREFLLAYRRHLADMAGEKNK